MATDALLRERAKYANKLSREGEYDDMSFGAAFNAAKAKGKKDFPWRGKTYTTETREERSQKAYSDTSRRRDVAPSAAPSPSPSAAPTLRSLLGTTAPEAKEDALTRIAGRQPTKRPEQERDEARDRAIAALSLMGGLGTNVGLRGAKGTADAVRGAVQASRGLEEARRARLAREMDRELPALAPKERVRVEGTKGGVYRSTKDEKAAEPKAEFRSRTADRMDEREMEFRHGGKTKSYAKGGSVKGSGCEQRGLRKCKVY